MSPAPLYSSLQGRISTSRHDSEPVLYPPLLLELQQLVEGFLEGNQVALGLRALIVSVADVDSTRLFLLSADDYGT